MFIEPERSRFLIELLNGNESEKKVALKLLHEETYISLYRKLISMYGCDVETAEDVLQETFIKVYTTSNYPDNPKTLYAWLTMISRNVLIDIWRKKSHKIQLYKSIQTEFNEADNDGQENLTLLSESEDLNIDEEYSEGVMPNDVIAQLENAELQECIQAAMKKLREKSTEKALVLEWNLEGLSSKEMSELIKRTDDATRRLLSDARKALRKLAQPCYEMIGG